MGHIVKRRGGRLSGGEDKVCVSEHFSKQGGKIWDVYECVLG